MSTTIGRFDGATEFDLPIECTYDFEVAGAKYLHALAEGEIPLILLFSGTVFTRGGQSGFSVEPLSWSSRRRTDARVGVARHDGPLLPQQRLDPGPAGHPRLAAALRASRALPTWDQAFECC